MLIGLSILALCLGILEPAAAALAPQRTASAAPSSAVTLANIELIDMDGNPVDFAREIIGDRIVAINFLYTTCGTVCPLLAANFRKLQDKLGDRLGKEAWLISISLDPVTDTPARMKEYAARFKPRPGWLWLTGSQENVERVLKGLGTTTANFRDHAPLTLVGDGRTGQWSRFNTLTSPDLLRSEILALLTTRKKQ